MSTPVGISFWRVAGMTYNQYSQVATAAMRKCLKPDAAAKRKADVLMRERTFVNGEASAKSKLGWLLG